MKRSCPLALYPLLLAAFCLLGGATVALAQTAEAEPNNTCLTAQDFGAVAVPFVVDGGLDPTDALPGAPGDVDFYRFQVSPGSAVQVDLEGVSTGKGTLGDPFLGFFFGDCTLAAYDDDGGEGLNSRLTISVPGDGILILAAQACCDPGFLGGGEGTYQLTLTPSPFAPLGSIEGRVVDAQTGNPLPGYWPYNTWVALRQCADPADPLTCEWANSSPTNDDGSFRFSTDSSGQPLPAGSYLVDITALGYQASQSGPFTVGQGQDYDVGDIPLTPFASIGSLSGRVVDARTGDGLSGLDYPYTYVDLYWCETAEYCWYVKGASAEGDGQFLFVSDYPGQLPPGDYLVQARAQDYQPGQSEVVDVQEGEDRAIGEIPLEPNPIFLSEMVPCGGLPSEGGICQYTLRITNRSGERLQGAAWSLVNGWGIGSLVDWTYFQTSMPIKMTLQPGASRVAHFRFFVPGTVPDGALICADGRFGEGRQEPFFNVLAHKGGFCIQKGVTGYSVLPKKEAQQLSRNQRQPLQKVRRPKQQ